MSKLGKRSLMDNDQLLEGGGGGGGYRSFSKGPQDIRRSPAEERAMVAKKEVEAVRKKDEARVADEARYLADKKAGNIRSTFPIKKNAEVEGKKKGGVVSASKRADGRAQRGKTKGRMV
jgi:hypothetical protein